VDEVHHSPAPNLRVLTFWRPPNSAETRSIFRYCLTVSKDPGESLELFRVGTVATFLHWLLKTRKATLRKASTLQTYWNTLCLVRKAETGLHIIPQELKAAMVGVSQDGFVPRIDLSVVD
jgi:hypothetical protein